uniref:Uncharacterized protein n=1 Tax=Crocidura lasiura lispivirus 2 TaxID=3139472 RepID=A0AB38ZJP5_9MONO
MSSGTVYPGSMDYVRSKKFIVLEFTVLGSKSGLMYPMRVLIGKTRRPVTEDIVMKTIRSSSLQLVDEWYLHLQMVEVHNSYRPLIPARHTCSVSQKTGIPIVELISDHLTIGSIKPVFVDQCPPGLQ